MKAKFIENTNTTTKPEKVPTFGTTYTDYMFQLTYSDGQWHSPTIKPYENESTSPAALVYHYAQAVFEGMKAYKIENDEVNLFRPEENFNRLNKSLVRMAMPTLDIEKCIGWLKELLTVEKDWIYDEDGASLYIRPYVYATQPQIGVKCATTYVFNIILMPVGPYYSGRADILVEENFVRAVRGGTGDIKFAGNYGASLLALNQAQAKGFTDVLWLDAIDRKYIEEVGTMNIFFKIGDKVVTPKLSGTILPGITRKSLIHMSKDLGIEVEERALDIEEVAEAYKNGELTEIFGSGTAAVITPVDSLTYRGLRMDMNYTDDSVSTKLKKRLVGIQKGTIEDKYNWTDRVR